MSTIYTVSRLNQEIKWLLESNPGFRDLFVAGEISNYKPHPSGHHYLTLRMRARLSARSCFARMRQSCASGCKTA